MGEAKLFTGGCHCKNVRYEVRADLKKAMSCNCSICGKTGALLAFVPAADFTLLKGADELTDYQFHRKHIHHFFCKTCGIRSFARGAGPDGKEMVALNLRCIDDLDLESVPVTKFDGKSL
jgi:hypothetical protein